MKPLSFDLNKYLSKSHMKQMAGYSLKVLVGPIVSFLILMSGAPAWAQGIDSDSPYDVTADSVDYEQERDLYVARGNVRVVHPDKTVTADWMSINNTTRRGIAIGNVVVIDASDTLFADSVEFNIDSFETLILDGRLEGEMQMTGRTVRRVGEKEFTFEDATFTSCRCPDDGKEPWKVKAKTTDLEVGGYGTARNTTFNVLGVPVVWLPWMLYPVKTERQTGFLFPEIGFSTDDGGDWGLPFFWAARDDLNVTYTPSWIADQGFLNKLEIEHVMGERGKSDLYFAFINDDDEVEESDLSTPFDPRRWGLDWLHDQDLPFQLRGKIDAKIISDNMYSYDYDGFSDYRNDRFVESKAFLERSFGENQQIGVHGGLWYADDQQNPDDQDRDRFLLQRVPSLAFSAPDLEVPKVNGLFASLNVEYAYFWSKQQADESYPNATAVRKMFLDTGADGIPNGHERGSSGSYEVDGSGDDSPSGFEGNGRFDEGEPLLDKGSRLVLNPRLAYPLRIADKIEILPEIGYHSTFYQTEEQGSEIRQLLTAQLDVRTRLRGSFNIPILNKEVLHVLEPRIAYTAISSDSQSDNPLLVPQGSVLQDRIRQLELSNITRDPSDRIDSLNAITIGVSNRFYGKADSWFGEERKADGDNFYVAERLVGELSLGTQYNFSNDKFNNLILDGTMYPGEGWSSRFNFGYDLDNQRVGEGMLEFGWNHERGHRLGFMYRYLRDIPPFFEAFRFDDDRFEEFEINFKRVNQVGVSTRVALSPNWALEYGTGYSLEESLNLSNEGALEYISKCRCWAIRLEVEDDRIDGLEIELRYQLIGLGDDTDRPFKSTGSRGRRASTRLLDPSR